MGNISQAFYGLENVPGWSGKQTKNSPFKRPFIKSIILSSFCGGNKKRSSNDKYYAKKSFLLMIPTKLQKCYNRWMKWEGRFVSDIIIWLDSFNVECLTKHALSKKLLTKIPWHLSLTFIHLFIYVFWFEVRSAFLRTKLDKFLKKSMKAKFYKIKKRFLSTFF